MQQVNTSFNAFEVVLQGSNLIEASAGTGKTFSIAVLALRLILNRQATIREILMVTFTKAAAAEMEIRIRMFLRDALKVAKGNGEDVNPEIVKLVKQSPYPSLTQSLLEDALLQIDRASVMTIHSFSAKVLAEYAFESGQIFNASTLDPETYQLLETEVFNQAWREKVTVLDKRILYELTSNKRFRTLLQSLTQSIISGKRMYTGVGEEVSDVTILLEKHKEMFLKLCSEIECLDFTVAEQAVIEKEQRIIDYLKNNWVSLKEKAQSGNAQVKKYLLPEFEENNTDKLIKKLNDKPAQYVQQFFPAEIWQLVREKQGSDNILSDLKKQKKDLFQQKDQLTYKLISLLADDISRDITKAIQTLKSDTGSITFDDMIIQLHRAIMSGGQEKESGKMLIAELRKRYKAVFVDEFQDTDRYQYEIFYHLFQSDILTEKPVLFYIGDPKQSIYAFRKADLATYFRALDTVDVVHRMNSNYRSTFEYIAAMNEFFLPKPGFDVFLSEKMHYHPVLPPENEAQKKTGGLYYQSRPLEPLRILFAEKKQLAAATAKLVSKLLYDKNYTLKRGANQERIRPSDIGLLVRNNIEGRLLKEELSHLSVPAITIDDTKILSTDEAVDIQYFLESVHRITRGNINRAFLTHLGGYSIQELETLDEDALLLRFRSYQECWKNDGVYVLLRTIFSDLELIKRFYISDVPYGERILSNTFQLMEVLHGMETAHKYTPEETLLWLKKGIQGDAKTGDQYSQRIESDEDTVKIVTIHSSKGLEYNIVIAPSLNMEPSSNHSVIQFYDQGGYYVALKKFIENGDKEQLFLLQNQQENRRLQYVALTRAKYHTYVFTNHAKTEDDALGAHIIPLLQTPTELENIRFISDQEGIFPVTNERNLELAPPEYISFEIEREEKRLSATASFLPAIPAISIKDSDWMKTSYSGLKREGIPIAKNSRRREWEQEYDQFVFHQLKKGSRTGDLLHYIFERIDFADSSGWRRTVEQAMNRYQIRETEDGYTERLLTCIQTVLTTELNTGAERFSLQSVQRENRVNELEFDVPLTSFSTAMLPEIIEDNIPLGLKDKGKISGILNGKMDLVFLHQGKYYLLDWKTNFLGDSTEDYRLPGLNAAMEEHHYFLQYYLYTLALSRFMKIRIPEYNYEHSFGGVFYLFVRGMRNHYDTGIYFHKPSENAILQLEALMLQHS